MTNLQSDHCVPRAIGWAMERIRTSGELSEMLNSYMPVAACTAEESVASRRLASDEGDQPSRQPARPSLRLHRRLKGGTGDSGVTAPAAPSSAPSMEVTDFFGIFLLWGVATIAVLCIHSCQMNAQYDSCLRTAVRGCVAQWSNRTRRVTPLSVEAKASALFGHQNQMERAASKIQATYRGRQARLHVEEQKKKGVIGKGLDGAFGKKGAKMAAFPKGLNVNDHSAMLKHLVLSIGKLTEEVEGMRENATSDANKLSVKVGGEHVEVEELTASPHGPDHRRLDPIDGNDK